MNKFNFEDGYNYGIVFTRSRYNNEYTGNTVLIFKGRQNIDTVKWIVNDYLTVIEDYEALLYVQMQTEYLATLNILRNNAVIQYLNSLKLNNEISTIKEIEI